MPDAAPIELSDKSEAFVMHFGEMGSRWGFNRTVAQILALLVIYPRALNADQISSVLNISRGNTSMGIKELQSWRLLRIERIPNDRKDYFSTAGSIWDMAHTVFEERQKREIDPTLSMLRSHLLDQADHDDAVYAQEKMRELHDLLELITQWAGHLNNLSAEQLQSLMKMGSGISKMLDMKDKILGRR